MQKTYVRIYLAPRFVGRQPEKSGSICCRALSLWCQVWEVGQAMPRD